MGSVLELLYQQDDDTLVVLPSGLEATIKEMTGFDQKLLTGRGQVTGDSINKVLASCTVSIGDVQLSSLKEEEAQQVMKGLLSADRQTLLFQIRRISLSDCFLFKTKCPECGVVGEWEVKLSEQDFPVKPFQFQKNEDGTDNKKFHVWESKLRSGLKFKANFISGEEEMKAARNKTKLHSLSDLEMRDLRVFDEATQQWLAMVPARLSDKIIAEIRETMKEVEGNQDDSVEVTCTNCGQEAQFNLLSLPDFMLPSVRS
jgi:endogenous inhibitor of DNA gyrase (YacG/DUF329 family)